MRMSNDEFNRECIYQVIMHFFRKMLKENIITADEYREIEKRKCAKYKPVTGTLLSGKNLILAEI